MNENLFSPLDANDFFFFLIIKERYIYRLNAFEGIDSDIERIFKGKKYKDKMEKEIVRM